MRKFERLDRIVWAIILISALAMIVGWILIAVLGYTALTSPEGIGEYIGKILKGINSVK